MVEVTGRSAGGSRRYVPGLREAKRRAGSLWLAICPNISINPVYTLF